MEAGRGSLQTEKGFDRWRRYRPVGEGVELRQNPLYILPGVSPKKGAGVADLSFDQSSSDRKSRLRSYGYLASSQFDMFRGQAMGDALEPSTVGEPAHWHLPHEGRSHELGTQLDVAVNRDLGDVDHAYGFDFLVVLGDHGPASPDADLRTLLGDMQRAGGRVAGYQPAGPLQGALCVQVGLVGEADAHQGTSRAFRAIDQWWRWVRSRCDVPQLLHELEGLRHEFVIEGNGHPLAGLREVDLALGALVPVVTEEEPDRTQLHELGRPCRTVFGWSAPFDLNGSHPAVSSLDDVCFGDQPQTVRPQHHRPGLPHRVMFFRSSYPTSPRIDVPMHITTLHGVGIVHKPRLNPLEIKEPQTILKLIDHPNWNESWYVRHSRWG